MKVIVGSENPVKIGAVKEVFEKVFGPVDVIGVKVDSHVSAQPIGEETFEGAKNRAFELRDRDADFFVGLEGGIIKLHGRWFTFGVSFVLKSDGRNGVGVTSMIELPNRVVERVLSGRELGDVMDEISGEIESKKKGGTAGFFTKNAVTRKDMFVQATVLALAPFIREEFYKK